MTARVAKDARDQWVTSHQLEKEMNFERNTIYKTLKRLIDDGLAERVRIHPTKGKWFFKYRATEAGQAVLDEGPLPTGSETTQSRELEVLVDTLQQILDTGRIKFESRQVMTAFDPYVTKVLRDQCNPPKKKDRAQQRVYACHAFTITIPHTGNAQLNLTDYLNWDKELLAWMMKAGLSHATADEEIKKIWRQIPGGKTRAEIPVLEQAIRRLKVKADVHTTVTRKGEYVAEVTSNINYSLNDIGLEYFGTTQWVDAIIRTLIALQHTTMVSEASRDQWISDALEAVDKLRKEQEAKEQAEQEEKDEKWKRSLV